MNLQAPAPIPVEVSEEAAPFRPPSEAELVEAGKLSMAQLPRPVQAPEPPPRTEAPPPAAEARYTIAIRLTNDDLITAGETDGLDKAEALGIAVVGDLTTEDGEWPFFAGRYINPEVIVSVDLLPQKI